MYFLVSKLKYQLEIGHAGLLIKDASNIQRVLPYVACKLVSALDILQDFMKTCTVNSFLLKLYIKSTQSQMSLVVSDIVLKNKFAIKRYETVLYTCNI